MRTKCAQFPGFSLLLRQERELFKPAAREQKSSAEGKRRGLARVLADGSLGSVFFPATPGFEDPPGSPSGQLAPPRGSA